MKRWTGLALTLVMLSVAPAALAGPGDANPDSVYLFGEFVDPVCIFQHGMQGKAQRECAMVPGRVEQGMYFLDLRQRRLYSVIGLTHWENPREAFLNALGDTFAVRAKIWRRAGSAAIAINALYPYQAQPEASFAMWPWRWEWSVLAGCGVLALLFLLCLTWWRRRLGAPDDAIEWGHLAAFLSGLLVVVLSLNGPIHDLSDLYFFSAHMVQHLLLAQVFPLLFLLGMPVWLRQGLLRPGAIGATWAALAGAPAGFILYTVVFSIWHVPALYNLMMRDHGFHILMHLMVMATATMMWWPIVGGAAVRRPINPGAKMLYLFFLGTPMMVVAAMIVFAQRPLYEWYAYAPPLWGQTPLEDQRLGGLIMWVPGGMFYWAVMSVVYFRWSHREQRGEQEPFDIPRVPQAG